MAKKPSSKPAPETNDDHEEMHSEEAPQQQRVYQSTVEFDSDLFRLKTQKMKKNVHWNKQTPDWRSVDHEHFFHTYDSGGKKMTDCNSVGGHFHIMEVTHSAGGVPVVKCSGPKKFIHKKGKKIMVDASDVPRLGDDGKENEGYDGHVHEVVYERSSRMKPRVMNAESIKVINEDANKTASIPGIQS